MKTRLFILLFLCFAAALPAYAANTPTVESKGAFFKITNANKPVGTSVDRDAPEILYIRKSTILRVSVIFTARSTEFRVIIVTSGPTIGARIDDDKVLMTNDLKTYFYNFPNEAAATAFCEAIISEQNG